MRQADSTDPEFVDAVAHGPSQGRLGKAGIRAALYALYLHFGESDLGLYGVEAASAADADRLETAMRGIWAYNASLGRARVHRTGTVDEKATNSLVGSVGLWQSPRWPGLELGYWLV